MEVPEEKSYFQERTNLSCTLKIVNWIKDKSLSNVTCEKVKFLELRKL